MCFLRTDSAKHYVQRRFEVSNENIRQPIAYDTTDKIHFSLTFFLSIKKTLLIPNLTFAKKLKTIFSY